MRIMVTGAAGFIGSHFVDYVLENHPDDQVVGFDCLTYAGNVMNLELALPNKRFQFVKGDIRNLDNVNSIAQKVDIIVNFAAETHVDRSIASSSEFISSNIVGTHVLLQSAVENKITRFHQISTDEVYGSVEAGFSSEGDNLFPSSAYSASKAAADLLAYSFCQTHNLNVTISRSSNNYGTRQHEEKLIPTIILSILNNKKIPIYGDGLNLRDWLHVEDHVQAVYKILLNGRIKNVYNIGTGKLKSNIEITRKILNQFNLNENFINFCEDRKGHDRRYAISSIKAQNELKFDPQKKFEEEIPSIVEYYRRLFAEKVTNSQPNDVQS